MTSVPMTPGAAPVGRSLTESQLALLEGELKRELRWLTGTTALEWFGEAAESQSAALNGGSRKHDRLNQVLEALDRIKSGTYGICKSCRTPIPFRRLEIVPETTMCIACHPAA